MRRIIHVNRPMKRAMTNVSQSERILLFGAFTIRETPRIVVVWQNRRNSFVYEGDRSRRFSIIINHTGEKKRGGGDPQTHVGIVNFALDRKRVAWTIKLLGT